MTVETKDAPFQTDPFHPPVEPWHPVEAEEVPPVEEPPEEARWVHGHHHR